MANCKLLLMYLCFAEISTIASSNSMTIEGSVTTPIPIATVGLFSEMMASLIQPSSTFEAANEKLIPTSITTTYSTESQMSTTTPLMIATTVSIMLSPSTAPTPTTEICNTAPSDPQTTTEMTTNTKDRPPGPQSTTLPPISAETLALIAIGLSGMNCCCVAVFSLGCVLTLTCRGCKKSRQARKEFQDSVFRSATLKRPLGDAIRDSFPIAIENPTFEDLSPDMKLKDNMSTINRKDTKR